MTDEQLFDRAIQLGRDDRDELLTDACQSTEQRARVEALLDAHAQADSLLDTEAMVLAGDAIVEQPIRKAIGDFDIIRELGRGGMGVVYEARQKSLKRKVALKILSSGLGLSSKAILRFRREAEAAGKLHHTNIVPIYTTGEDKGIHYYAMELIDGPSLDAVIKDLKQETTEKTGKSESDADVPSWLRRTALYDATGPAPVRTDSSPVSSSSTVAQGTKYFDHVATMIAEVADALEHAHEHGVIHRDIKPSNLLLAPDGRLSVNDFGLARMLEQPGMTMSGEFVGSPLYMSPEQITAGRVTIDHRTDIYSLGTTLYELLVLFPPFPGQTRDQVLSQILHKDAASTRKLNRRVPVDLDTICMKAIDKDPDHRYQTAGALAEDLRRFVRRHAIAARRIGPLGHTVRWVKRNPSWACLILVVAAVACTGFAIRKASRISELADVSEQIFEDLIRRGPAGTAELIYHGEELGASPYWLNFHRGLRQLFRQDYEDARLEFQKALQLQPNSISAKALLATSYMWSGNEYEYFRLLSEIDPDDAQSFEDKFFLGYAHHWGDSKLSMQLLAEAIEMRGREPYIVFLHGVARRGHATIELVDLEDKQREIVEAIREMESSREWMQESSLILKELTIAYLHQANIYQRLADSDPANRASHLAVAEQSRTLAMNMLPSLRASEDSFDSQYAAVMLVSELRAPEDLISMADDWQRKGVGSPYAAHFLSMKLATLGKYERANQWLLRELAYYGTSEHLNVETFVKVVDPKRSMSLASLLKNAVDRIKRKEETGQTQNIQFDVQSAMLLGDRSQSKWYSKDRLDDVIQKGCVYQPIRDYIQASDQGNRNEQALLDECASTPAANVSTMHARFYLGIEAIAETRWDDARRHLTACRNGGEFMFTVYFLSELLLAHEDQWKDWQGTYSGILDY